jgi:hypothetical protein
LRLNDPFIDNNPPRKIVQLRLREPWGVAGAGAVHPHFVRLANFLSDSDQSVTISSNWQNCWVIAILINQVKSNQRWIALKLTISQLPFEIG